ncbi:MAG: periplasmic heavy metal sensor [Flavobacteriales bacterium]|nr:periplasmic heavy metal sensor [Flavobacteriales bacterium]
MINKRFSKKVALLLAVIITGGLLTACKPHHGGPGGMMFDIMAYKLDLSDSQEEKLFAIGDEMKRIHEEHQADREVLKRTLIELVNDDEIDQQQVMGLLQEHQDRMTSAAPGVLEKIVDFHATLNSEQKAKIVEKIESHKGHHKMR